jgi:crotonobetainyl-CoA:carnitine CoA-transferase CaiB-like acyl-CoA transferase
MGEVAVLAALHHRKKTGQGQFIDLSQSENIMRVMSWVWPYQQLTGKTAMPAGNRDVSICPADTVYTADEKFVALAAPAPEEFKGLCNAMGQPELAEDPRFGDHLTRLKDENAADILGIVADWAKTKTAAEIEELAEANGFAASCVKNIKDVMEDEHSNARGYITEIDDPVLGQYKDNDFPVNMSRTPPRIKWSVRPVGFDNEYVMTKHLGKNKDQIQALYDCGAIGKWGDIRGRRPPADWDGKSGLIMSRDAQEKE